MIPSRDPAVSDVPPLERLHNLDAEFLYAEDDDAPLHIGCICTFEGPVPSRAEVARLFAAKLARVPRYRKRVRFVPLELGRPVWADDPHFDLAYHVRRTALPEPGDDAALRALIGRVMSQRLDRERPLWEVWIVEGLARGQWALLSKVHHAMADGISGADLLTTFLDTTRDAPLPEVVPWAPAPEPSALTLLRHAAEGARDDHLGLQRALWDGYLYPLEQARIAQQRAAGLVELARGLLKTSSGPLQGGVRRHRYYAHGSAKLADVQCIKKALGGTLNDVVLAAVAGGYRALLAHRGADPDDAVVRSLVPVSVRASDARGVFDNRVSMVFCDLAVRVADPVQRLHVIKAEMARLKASHMIEAVAWLNTLGDLMPSALMGSAARRLARAAHDRPQRSFATVTTNVPGPRQRLYLLGREMVHWYPYVPIAQGLRVGTAILSYDDELSFGVTADYDTVPDVEVITQGIEETVAALLAVARADRVQAANDGAREPHGRPAIAAE